VTIALLEVLAQLPDSTVYVNPWKLVTVAVLFVLWVLIAQWIDKDTVAVNTFRTVWNVASISCGTVAVALLLLLPNFWAAIGAFGVIQIAFTTIYIVHRNGLVLDDDKVCTAAHLKRIATEGFSGGAKKKEKREVSERVRITGADREVVRIPVEEEAREQFALAQDVLFDGLWRRATRVEVIPAGQASKVRVQIDGETTEREPLARPEGDAILLFFKKAAGLNLEERRKPQKGQIMAALGDTHRYDVVVRTNGSTAGEKLSLRIVGDEKEYKVDDIGLTVKQLETMRAAMNAEHGMILLSAPPGEGLTTSIYSFARSHDAFLQNIQTVEYERELVINNITQRVYEPSDEKTFTAELQRVIRTDPDVIALPEIREREAASMAAKAATGKQIVYAAIKSLDLFDALKRWASMVGDAKLLSQSLLVVTHQRLVRVLCPSCKAPYKPDPATLQKINMPADKILYKPPAPQYDKHGNPVLCQNCHGTGYVGRTGVFNMLVVDDDLRKVIARGAALPDIRQAAMKKGGLGLQQQALQKVFDGITSIEEVVRATRPPKIGTPKAPKASGNPRKPSAA
jgi:type II secretory ATPase GspE/PulE/Tfp pilus assembly ATPase PilB-like protein